MKSKDFLWLTEYCNLLEKLLDNYDDWIYKNLSKELQESLIDYLVEKLGDEFEI